MGKLQIVAQPMQGLCVIQHQANGDSRGCFERLFCADELADLLRGRTIRQINWSLTCQQGVVRGMHFQHPPHCEVKLVTCLAGRILDVAVDIRRGSPTFLQHFSVELTAENRRALLLPEGFAHGFQALSPDCKLLYCHTAAYAPGAEDGLNAVDPSLGIRWPLPIAHRSPRDESFAFVAGTFAGVSP